MRLKRVSRDVVFVFVFIASSILSAAIFLAFRQYPEVRGPAHRLESCLALSAAASPSGGARYRRRDLVLAALLSLVPIAFWAWLLYSWASGRNF